MEGIGSIPAWNSKTLPAVPSPVTKCCIWHNSIILEHILTHCWARRTHSTHFVQTNLANRLSSTGACAAQSLEYPPRAMEVLGSTPTWNSCSFNQCHATINYMITWAWYSKLIQLRLLINVLWQLMIFFLEVLISFYKPKTRCSKNATQK